ncbi:FGGY-family carbohydrate kinase [Elstera cyanobacteriorum]|uniref:FGGY-family carbohydrate kinase n=1 Tax=Elstera cyanobacteriorum TaxID=2022747 RepID=UPI002354E376|nr:FGGY-family carbohydrate kinase [Elstera cyanobacteriorum]MCK6444241.1 carbohydrate kinase [Elstera cyanobacteriorum]
MADTPQFLLGLDVGNTVIKAVLFDLAGRQIAADAIDGHALKPQPGHVERDLAELWANGRSVIRNVLTAAGIAPSAIAAIGCAGHGNGLYLLDRDRQPLLGIQSLDGRGAALAAELEAAVGDALFPRCLQRPWPAQTPVLLAWVKRHAPDVYARAGTLLFCKDYLNFKLTGRLANEMSDASGAGLLDMADLCYSADLLALYGLSDAGRLLPPLISPADIVGTVTADAAAETGLAVGTPVIGGYFDVIASAMGSGVVRPGEASIITGSWSINQVFSDRLTVDPQIFMVSAFARDRFVTIESSATSAANLEWYVREFVERGDHSVPAFDHCNRLVGEIVPAADDPYFHPFLYGSRQGATFRAGFYGIAGWHREGHLIRAMFEGIVFEHRRHLSVLQSAGLGIGSAVMSGGGSRSPHWPQIMADALNMPITVAACRETGALGAAIGAAVGTGLFSSYEAAVTAMTQPVQHYHPTPALRPHYDRRYQQYLALTEALRPFWAAEAQAAPSHVSPPV